MTYIFDSNIISQIDPIDACDYLQSTGWEKSGEIGNKAFVYSRDDFYSDLLVPISKTVKDFNIRYAEILNLLSEYYNRDKQDVLQDILYFGADIAKFRIDSPNSRDGTLSISDADKFYSNIKHVVISSARAVIDAKPKYPSNIPKKVQTLYDNSRIGQTQRGSYVISVIIRHSRPNPDEKLMDEKPFERLAFEYMNSALSTVDSITENGLQERLIDEAVHQGVSYNLCKHLSEIQEITSGGSLDVKFQWSSRFSKPSDSIDDVRIDYKQITDIKKVAKILSTNSKTGDATIHGYVIGLLKPEGHKEGKITVQAYYNGSSVRISMMLGLKDYLIAVKAHEENIQITCKGVVERVGNYFYMTSVSEFVTTRPIGLFD